MHLRGEQRTLVPKLITGLKAYHLQPNYRFLTVSNLHILLSSIPPYVPMSCGKPSNQFILILRSRSGETEIIFVCGEIDTREGIPKAMDKKRYRNVEHATAETVRIYREGVDALSVQYKLHIWIHPVTPPINPKRASPQ